MFNLDDVCRSIADNWFTSWTPRVGSSERTNEKICLARLEGLADGRFLVSPQTVASLESFDAKDSYKYDGTV